MKGYFIAQGDKQQSRKIFFNYLNVLDMELKKGGAVSIPDTIGEFCAEISTEFIGLTMPERARFLELEKTSIDNEEGA